MADALGKLYTSTAVVTMKARGKTNGITIAWMTRVSWSPPMVAISVGKTRFSHELIAESKAFCVCILRKDKAEVAELFGTNSGRTMDKFSHVQYTLSEGNFPIPEGTIAYMECEVVEECEAGDHTIFVGKVIREKLLEDADPLIFGEHTLL